MGYVVATPVFEGPIDLLLHVVSSHDIDILDLDLAPVVDAFVATLVNDRQSLNTDTLSEFLLVAAILLELKSKRLLPGPDEIDSDDELARFEERDLLLARLLECRAYAAAADLMIDLVERANRSVPREVGLDDDVVIHAPDLLAGVTPDRVAAAFRRAIATDAVAQLDLYHVTVDTVTVSEIVRELARDLPGRGRVSFRELTGHLIMRIDVIVRFLALLELCKLGRVVIEQGRTFGDLEVSWIGEADGAGMDSEVDAYEG